MDNLVVACADCNQLASNKVFSTFEAKKRYILQARLSKGLYVSNYYIRAYELKEKVESYIVN